ncbi:TfoX/Sxy family protein [[Eubacterium] cellulosolvens]
MKWEKSSQKLTEIFESLIPKSSKIEYRKMFGYPCCFINGNMFMGLHQENIFLRLSEKDKKNFLNLNNAFQFEPMPGRVMKEYVIVPSSLLKSKSSLKKWISKSLTYAKQLPAKKKKRKN